MTRASRVALGTLAVLQLLACVICLLLGIWGGDGRWHGTAAVLFFTAFITGVAAIP